MPTSSVLKLNALVRLLILAAGVIALAVSVSRATGGAAASADAGQPAGHNAAPPTASQDRSEPSSDALRPSDSVSGGIDLRHSKLVISLVWRGGSFKSQLPAGLRYLGVQRPISSQTSLEILFCTWQA